MAKRKLSKRSSANRYTCRDIFLLTEQAVAVMDGFTFQDVSELEDHVQE